VRLYVDGTVVAAAKSVLQSLADVAVALGILLLVACGGSGSVDVPSNHGYRLDQALQRLRAVKLRATFAGVSTPCGFGLPYVNVQSPRAPAQVRKHSSIGLTFGPSLIPSPAVPKVRPRWASVPHLVGEEASAAVDRLRAIWPCVHVRGTSATSASRLIIVGQHPPPGTRVSRRTP
jgi:hypothetical protein